MKMNIVILGTVAGLMLTAGLAQATLYSYNFDGTNPGVDSANNVAIADGNLVGQVNTINVSGTGNNNILDVNVYLHFTGG